MLWNAHFRVNRSDDCGANWDVLGTAGVSVHGAAPVLTFFTNQFGNPAKGKVARARSSDAWIAVDPGDGDVYAAYVSKDASAFGQIYVARSADQGVTWTSSRVTDGTRHSAFPEIAVALNGTLGVLTWTSTIRANKRFSDTASRVPSTTEPPGPMRSSRAWTPDRWSVRTAVFCGATMKG
jgi:hypothetical protein